MKYIFRRNFYELGKTLPFILVSLCFSLLLLALVLDSDLFVVLEGIKNVKLPPLIMG